MPTYEVELNGQTFEIEAPDDQSVNMAVRQLQSQAPAPAQENPPVQGGYSDAPEWTKPITALGHGAADMATGGFLDEIGAAADYAGSHILPWREPKTYEQALAETRADDKSLVEQQPVANVAGQVLGGVALSSKLAERGLSLAANAPANAGLGSMILRGSGDAAALGGIYGAGSGEGTTGRAKEAAKGAAIGAVLGAAIPVAARGVSSAYRTVADALAANQAARRAGTSPEVARMLTETLNADGSLSPQGMANMQRAGQEAMLADAGPNARAVLDTAIQRGGPGAVSARNAIDARVARGAEDLTGSLDEALGAPEGVFTARQNIANAARPAMRDAYNAAYDTAINYADPRGQALEALIRDRIPGNIITDANRLMQLGGHRSQQIMANIADDGTVTFQQMPDVRQIDYITRALRQAAESGEGQGALGGQTPIGAAYQNLSRDIRGTLRDLVPEYGNALDTAADPISRSQAVRLGSRAISPSMRTDEFADALQGMSMAERGAVGQGIRSEIEHKVSNVTRTVQDGNTDAREAIKALKDLSSRANRQKISLAIGEDAANRLFDDVDRIATSFELRASVAENSKTYARQAISGRIEEATAPGPIGKVAQGEPIKGVKRVVQALTGQTPENIARRQDAIYSDIADYLTRPADQAIPAFRAMTDFGNQTLANRVRAQELARLLSSGQRLAYPLGGQLREAAPGK